MSEGSFLMAAVLFFVGLLLCFQASEDTTADCAFARNRAATHADSVRVLESQRYGRSCRAWLRVKP